VEQGAHHGESGGHRNESVPGAESGDRGGEADGGGESDAEALPGGATRDEAATAEARAGQPSWREAEGLVAVTRGPDDGVSPRSGADSASADGHSPQFHQGSSSILAESGSGGEGGSCPSHDESGSASPYTPNLTSPDSPAIDAMLHTTHKFGFRSDHDDPDSLGHDSAHPAASATAGTGSTGGSSPAPTGASSPHWGDSAAAAAHAKAGRGQGASLKSGGGALSPTIAAVPLSGPAHTAVTAEEATMAGLGLGWTHHYPHQLHTSGTVRRWYSGKAVAANSNVRSAGSRSFRLQAAPARDSRSPGHGEAPRGRRDETGQVIPGSGSTREGEGALPALASSAPGMLGPHALWVANIRAATAAESQGAGGGGGSAAAAAASGEADCEGAPASRGSTAAGGLPAGMFQEEPESGGSLRRGRSEDALAMRYMRVTDDELEGAPFSLPSREAAPCS
jgi:hypothetical protein